MKTRAARLLVAATAGLALAAAGHAALAWHRYGRPRPSDAPPGGLDVCLPSYEVAERHAGPVAAPADLTFAAALDLRLDRSWLVRAIFGARALLLRSGSAPKERQSPTIADLETLGWRVVIAEPNRLMVFAAVTRPWEANPRFIGLALDDFVRFDEPGYVKIAWSIGAEPLGPASSRFVTETRVSTTDVYARRRFRLYWAAFAPGIRVIRREIVRLVRAEAEARTRAQSLK